MRQPQVGEVVVAGRTAGRPIGGVVDVAPGGPARAAREPAAAVTDPQVAGEIGGYPVLVAPIGEVRAGLGVREDPTERRGVRRESAGCVGVDRAVPVELSGLIGVSEQRERRHGHVHLRGDDANGRVGVGVGAAEQQVGREIDLQLGECWATLD